MNARRSWTLIAYDTPHDGRRRRFVKALEGVGRRVQHSIFEAWLTPAELVALKIELERACDPLEDSLLLIPVGGARGLGGPAGAASEALPSAVVSLGLASPSAPVDYWIV